MKSSSAAQEDSPLSAGVPPELSGPSSVSLGSGISGIMLSVSLQPCSLLTSAALMLICWRCMLDTQKG